MGLPTNVPESKPSDALPGVGLQTEQKMGSVHKQLTAALIPKNEQLSNAAECFQIAPPRMTLLLQFIVLLSVAALLAVLSFGALAYLLLPFWVYLGYCVYAYVKLCRLYGYSAGFITVLYGCSLILVLFIVSWIR